MEGVEVVHMGCGILDLGSAWLGVWGGGGVFLPSMPSDLKLSSKTDRTSRPLRKAS